MSWLSLVLLAAAVAVLVAAEWPRLEARFGPQARRRRERDRRKKNWRVVTNHDVPRSDSEEFAASVQRDLSQLPTIEEREGRGDRRSP